jgi:HNH endonuclease
MPKCPCPSCHPEVRARKREPRRERARRVRYDWLAIQRYHDEGHGFVACVQRFAVTHTAWNKAIATGRLRTTPSLYKDRRRRYDWAEVQAYYEAGHSYRECRLAFGFCAGAWEKARRRGEVRPRSPGMPLEQLLISNGGSRKYVKLRLLRSGTIENRCDVCGLTDWLGKRLIMHLDHINGVKNDHRLENLRMLCPNCHSQTDTYGARNKRLRRILQDQGRTV